MTKLTFPLPVFLRRSLLCAALAGGALSAATPDAEPVPAEAPVKPAGLLGTTYATITAEYLHLNDGPPSVARGLLATFNYALSPGLDLGYTGEDLRLHASGLSASAGRGAFSVTRFAPVNGANFFVMADAGLAVLSAPGRDVDSFTYRVGFGLEKPLGADTVLTLYERFQRNTSRSLRNSEAQVGGKLTVKLTTRLSLSLGLESRENYPQKHRSGVYSLGMDYRY